MQKATCNLLILISKYFIVVSQSLTQQKKMREEFRKCLVELIMEQESEQDAPEGPLSERDRYTLRYYYYIQSGADTVHVAPMESNLMRRYLIH